LHLLPPKGGVYTVNSKNKIYHQQQWTNTLIFIYTLTLRKQYPNTSYMIYLFRDVCVSPKFPLK
jgi:hypothetical protein